MAESTSETEKFHALVEAAFDRGLKRSPTQATTLGLRDGYDRWDDLSDEAAVVRNDENAADLRALAGIDYEQLDAAAKLSYRLFKTQGEMAEARHPFRQHDYPLNQLFGWQSEIPSFLINLHLVASVADAEAYLARLRALPALVTQLIDGLEMRAAQGVIPPRFVFRYVIADCRNIVSGFPIDHDSPDSPLMADFRSKVAALELPLGSADALLADAADALRHCLYPAYQDLIACAIRLEAVATTDDGVWKLPDGEQYYSLLLAQMTTTSLTAAEIHQFGLEEVRRIHEEMGAIMRRVDFVGTLQDFFRYVSTDPRFFYSNDESGRQHYLSAVSTFVSEMKARLGEAFDTQPRAELIVKAVEPFREKSAGLAFYQSPTPDGARPGIYYVNLADMTIMSKNQMAALAYHEVIPGHHMQLGIAVELQGVPRFQKFADYTAYAEGWGLYAERLAKEMGFYTDPFSDFGRLVLELWRATRLVVDTGLHFYRWTREKSIEWLEENTPNVRGEIVNGVERYIVMPGQATAYKVGMRAILALRTEAQHALGGRFSLPEFHDVVLTRGPVPLNILSDLVHDWMGQRAT